MSKDLTEPAEQREWLLREIYDCHARAKDFEERGEHDAALMRKGAIDGYIRTGWHFGLIDAKLVNETLTLQDMNPDDFPTVNEIADSDDDDDGGV